MDIADKDLIVFDLDGTLAPSKFPMDAEMGGIFARLLAVKKVAVISGSGFAFFQTNILNVLPHGTAGLNNLLLLPTSGTRMYTWKGDWHQEYAEDLTDREKKDVTDALTYALRATGFVEPAKCYGEIIEDRKSQITFSANGQNAPLEVKTAWDPTREKREKLAAILKPKLPGFDVKIGGTNSIDITKRGVNKAYGIHKLEQRLRIPIDRILFVGDKLMPGGNDYAARSTGVDCIQVEGPEEAKKLISGWL